MGDKYRSHICGEAEKETQWRYGAPPNYDLVNKLFEEGRTQEWPKGSLEATVENLMKTWEMELTHKPCAKDIRSTNREKFKFIVNGRKPLAKEELKRIGTYNYQLQSSLPQEFQYYKAKEETLESSFEIFTGVFPRGFAWEVLNVYSGPPTIAFKYRHWGFMEGYYKNYAPTGEKVEFTGIAIIKVDESMRLEELETFYDPGELFGGLLKGPKVAVKEEEPKVSNRSCPFAQ